MNKYLSVHHVGGRSGSRSFPRLNKFEKDIINVLYDADPDCIKQIEERNKALPSSLHVFPFCLGDSSRSTALNINYDAYTSSIKDLNLSYGSFYYFNKDHDYILSETVKTVEKRKVDLISLDNALQSKIIPVPPPDFLSVDTEGSEYEILQGAIETLKSSVLALVVEGEFHPMHKNQKLFGDIAQFLSNLGFHFVKFLSMGELSPYRASIGLRGEGFHMYADTLFLKRIENLELDNDNRKHLLMLLKMAFIAIVYNQFEYGLQCLHQTKNFSVPHSFTEELKGLSYYRFLKDLEEKADKIPTSFPKTFASKYTFETSQARFADSNHFSTKEKKKSGQKQEIKFTIKKFLKRLPFLYPIVSWIVRILIRIRRIILISMTKVFKRTTSVELVLLNYGLKNQAKTLKKNRIIQSQFL